MKYRSSYFLSSSVHRYCKKLQKKRTNQKKKTQLFLIVIKVNKPLSLENFALRYDVLIVIVDLIYVSVHCCTHRTSGM